MKGALKLTTIWLVGLMLTTWAWAEEASYRIRFDGKEIGRASMKQEKNPDGSIYFEMEASVAFYGERMEWFQSSLVAKDGTPIRYSSAETSGDDRNIVSVSYEKDGAHILSSSKDRSINKVVPYPKGSIKALSNLWFIHHRPKPGEKAAYWLLDFGTLKWERVVDVYKGPRRISVNSRSALAHLILFDDEEMYVSDRGMPLRLSHGPISQSLLIERI